MTGTLVAYAPLPLGAAFLIAAGGKLVLVLVGYLWSLTSTLW